jgi:hypothetical protein
MYVTNFSLQNFFTQGVIIALALSNATTGMWLACKEGFCRPVYILAEYSVKMMNILRY